MLNFDLTIAGLQGAYRDKQLSPRELIFNLLAEIRQDQHAAWLYILSNDEVEQFLQRLEKSSIDELPLYGVPFAIKDNIDLAGMPTTAACPEFAYTPDTSAFVVQRLIDAGAVPVGKTNLDQFATGLVGTRSPYGACKNAFNKAYIAGGSSSGSAVSVALGQTSFALGTDTAGSGRVPAAFNNIVGLKPTRGALSTRGVVPACRTLDCISVFALNCHDAATILNVAAGYDAQEPYSRPVQFQKPERRVNLQIAIPKDQQLNFFGNAGYAQLFRETIDALTALGHSIIERDISLMLDAARLLYEGPWVAERTLATEKLLRSNPDAFLPVTRGIIEKGETLSAMEVYSGQYQLQAYRRQTEIFFSQCDVLLLPTAGTTYRIEEVNADPISLNSNLGYYTNFMNLLDLSAVAVPAGFAENQLPFGVTVCAPATHDFCLLQLAQTIQHSRVKFAGVSQPLNKDETAVVKFPETVAKQNIEIAVCGAHLSGLPLNHQLTERNAILQEQTVTAASYRLYALAGRLPGNETQGTSIPARPGLVRDEQNGAAIVVEVWSMPEEQVGGFIKGIPAPLGIGKLELASGRWVNGFICEPCGIATAMDITEFGGWRAYIQHIGNM